MSSHPLPATRHSLLERIGGLETAAFFAALAALWLPVFYRLSGIWEYNDQYSHGWFVPLLAGWIFYTRWESRPAQDRPQDATNYLLWLLLAVLVLVLCVAYFVAESSPEWRLILWVLSGCAFLGSLAITQLTGGKPWTKHLWFAFFFTLVAVPWPSAPEKWLTLELSMLAARLSSTLLTLGGIPALCVGNIIELSTGTLGVNEACSGIRSFQSSIMAGLFLGELYMLRIPARFVLCLVGLVFAYALNIARMLVLGVAVESSGNMEAIDQWHDPAGFVILILTMAVLWGVCALAANIPGMVSSRLADRNQTTTTVTHDPAAAVRQPFLTLPGVILVAVVIFTAVGTEAWFRYKERSVLEAPGWSIASGAPGNSVVDEPLSDGVRDLLQYDEGVNRIWSDDQGRQLHLIYLRWNPSPKSAFLSTPHAPEWCQSSFGRRVLGRSDERITRVHGIPMRYHIYEIEDGTRRFHLLYIPNDARGGEELIDAYALGGNPGQRWERFRWALEGRRNTGNRSLQLSIMGEKDAASAEARLLEVLPQVISREN